MRLPEAVVLVPCLGSKLLWPRKRRQRTASLLKGMKLGCGTGARFVHAVDLDPVRGTGNMKTPVPCRPDR